MSRRLRYQVAVSLDGFIAGPNGESEKSSGTGGRVPTRRVAKKRTRPAKKRHDRA